MFHWLTRLSIIFSSPLIGGFSPHTLSLEKTKPIVLLECVAVCHTRLYCRAAELLMDNSSQD